MATVISKGKKKIVTNDGSVQLDINSNRILHYDQDSFRFVIGKTGDGSEKILMSKEGENVLNV
jgi:hypothetical protein